MVNPKIVDASEVKRHPRVSPATRMVEAARAQGFLTAEDVAEHFEVSIETIRRLGRKKNDDGTKVYKAPSKAARTGDLVVWLYTQDDLAELGGYFGKRVTTTAKRTTRKRKG